jgi:hypothetical protein
MLRERNCGYGILVSQVPKETEAFYTLRAPSEVKTPSSLMLDFCIPVDLFSQLICPFHLPNRYLGDGIPQFVGEMEGTVTMNE